MGYNILKLTQNDLPKTDIKYKILIDVTYFKNNGEAVSSHRFEDVLSAINYANNLKTHKRNIQISECLVL